MKDFDTIFAEAHAAGMKAGSEIVPTPMHVVQRADPLDDNSPIVKRYAPVMDGVCGFAWIRIKGNTAFAKWGKARNYFRPCYPSGLSYWVGFFNQSLTRKEAYADAFAKVLNDNGILAFAGSRMD